MGSFHVAILLAGVVLFSGGCSSVPKTDAVTQGSLINALLAGLYDGTFTQKDVAAAGDLGIGTFNRLDGEMIVLDGVTYQANSKSEISILSQYRAPFFTVKHFLPEGKFKLEGPLMLDGLKAALDARLADRNHVYAFRVKGAFKAVVVRSVPSQQKPYPLLTEVVKTQPVFERKDISGVIVGFFVPAYAQGTNVAGYHFHFLSDDKTFGGHLLALEMTSGIVEFDRGSELRIIFPDDEAFRLWNGQILGDAAINAVEAGEARQSLFLIWMKKLVYI